MQGTKSGCLSAKDDLPRFMVPVKTKKILFVKKLLISMYVVVIWLFCAVIFETIDFKEKDRRIIC